MAVLGFSDSGMGRRVEAEDPECVYFLHGWRGDEDEDVIVDCSDGSSEGEGGGPKRLSEYNPSTVVSGRKEPTVVKLNKAVDFPETSIEETSEAGGQECDSSFLEARDSGLDAGGCIRQPTEELEQDSANGDFSMFNESSMELADPQLQGQKVVEQTVREFSPGESSSMKECEEPSARKRPNEGKRLDARRFRNIFAAKLGGSKKLKNGLSAEGRGREDVGLCLFDRAVSSSSVELSGGMPSLESGLKTKLITASQDEQEHENISHTDTQVEQAKSSSLRPAKVTEIASCKVFSRKRKHANKLLAQAGENIEQATPPDLVEEGDTVQTPNTMDGNDCFNSEVKAKATFVGLEKAVSVGKGVDGSPGRSKRPRKDNTQKDYIPWSAFGRSPVKKSDRNKIEGSTFTKSDSKITAGKNERLGSSFSSSGELLKVAPVSSLSKEDRKTSSVGEAQGASTENSIGNTLMERAEGKGSLESIPETISQGSLRKDDARQASQGVGHGQSKVTCQEKKPCSQIVPVSEGQIQEARQRQVSANRMEKEMCLGSQRAHSHRTPEKIETCKKPTEPLESEAAHQQLHGSQSNGNCMEAEDRASHGLKLSQRDECLNCKKHRRSVEVNGTFCSRRNADLEEGNANYSTVQEKQSSSVCLKYTSSEKRIKPDNSGDSQLPSVALIDESQKFSKKSGDKIDSTPHESIGIDPCANVLDATGQPTRMEARFRVPDFAASQEARSHRQSSGYSSEIDGDSNRVSNIEDTEKDEDKSLSLPEDSEYFESYGGMDDHDSVCNQCKLGGNLICCDGKGCKLTYHIGCLDPPLRNVPPGDWYCPDCAYKRIFAEVHSISKGIESIWDVRESNPIESLSKTHVVCSLAANDTPQRLDGKELPEASHERLYFVKFKGVAHFHNVWLPESQVLKQAPKLLHFFKKRLEQGKASRWDPEWAKPCRVIGNRLTMLSKRPPSVCEGDTNYRPGRYLEWCIKWKNLGYEACTWEPADREPLDSVHAKELIKRYEVCSEKARQCAQRGKEDVKRLHADAVSSFSVQPGWLRGEQLSHSQMDILNKLRKHWQSRSNGIVVNEAHQERIITTIAFLVCLIEEFQAANPILVVVPPLSVAMWESAFQKWASTANVVTYGGSKEAREIIQKYEFYNENGILMAQTVLTSFDTLNMDVEYYKGLKLEALVIDECQRLKGSKTLKNLRQLDTVYRLLLFSEPLKSTADEYHQLLSIVSNANDAPGTWEQAADEDVDLVAKLKSRVDKHIVYEYEHESESIYPKEYWVPVEMTTFQVEEYCKLLIDKCDSLTRSKRGDRVSSPHELLLKIRACCNHPYMVNPKLQESRAHMPGKDLLEFGIQASGKLKLLDIMLSQAKSSGKRVVIITQMHLRSEKTSQMEILDDYMQQQFGVNSYERVDACLAMNKKMTAVQRFNAQDSGCFVFLLDKRACSASIKLLSVNCVVIFDSDWNPQIDIQALTKVGFNPQIDNLTICRFYSSHTVEERVLISARKNMDLDNNYSTFTLSLCQKLLRWGARINFALLDKNSGQKDQVKTAQELSYSREDANLLLGPVASTEPYSNDRYWTTAVCPREAGRYSKGACLYGETDEELAQEDTVAATDFWLELLRDRQIESHDAQGRELRTRKKVQYCEDSFTVNSNTQGSIEEDDELRRKKRRISEMAELCSVPIGLKSGRSERETLLDPRAGTEGFAGAQRVDSSQGLQKALVKPSECAEKPSQILKKGCIEGAQQQSGNEGTVEPVTGVRTEQQQLLLSMKPDLARLCQALQFQEDTALHVEHLLSSIGSSFKFPKEKHLLHAIELSLCWLAAEQQHYSIDRHATLSLAESCFGVQLDKVETVYAKLEERWKKRFAAFEDSVQRSLRSRGQDHDIVERADPKLVDAQPGKELSLKGEIQSSRQAGLNASPLEQQRPPTLSEKVAPSCHLEERAVIEQRNEGDLCVGSCRVSSEQQQPSPRSRTLMKEKVVNQKRERMQFLLNIQKSQITNLDRIKKLFSEKLKERYLTTCSKIKLLKLGSVHESQMLSRENNYYLKNKSMLGISFKSVRDNIVKRQSEEREKENKLMTSRIQMISAGQIPPPLPSIDVGGIDVSETYVYSVLPAYLKSVLGTLDFGVAPVINRAVDFVATSQGTINSSAVRDHLNQNLHASNGIAQNSLGPGRLDTPVTSSRTISICEPISQASTRQTQPGGSPETASIPGKIQMNSQASRRHLDGPCQREIHRAQSTSQQLQQRQQHQYHDQQRHHQNQQQQEQQQPRLSTPSTDRVGAQHVAITGQQQHLHPDCQQPEQQQLRLSTPSTDRVGQVVITGHQEYPFVGTGVNQPPPAQPPQLQAQLIPQPCVLSESQPRPHLQLASQQQLPQFQVQQVQAVTVAPVGQHRLQDMQSFSNTSELGHTIPTSRPVALTSGTVHLPATISHGMNRSTSQLGGMSASPLQVSSGAGMNAYCAVAQRGNTPAGNSVGTAVTRSLQNISSRLNQPHHTDPLVQELMRLRKEQDKLKSAHEAEKDRLNAQYRKELEAIQKKFRAMIQEEDEKYTQKAATLETNMKKVEMNRRLAEVFRLKNTHDNSGSVNTGTASAAQDFIGVAHMQSRQQQVTLANMRTPSSTLQGILIPPVLSGDRTLPSASPGAAALNSASVFERPVVPATSASMSAGVVVQSSSTHAGAVSSYAQIQATGGMCLQSAHANSPVPLMPCQSRPTHHNPCQSPLLRESLLSRSPTQHACQANQAPNRMPSAMASVLNPTGSSLQYAIPVSSSQNAHPMNVFMGGTCLPASPNQFTGGSAGRTSTYYVTTYSTAVASHSNATLPSSDVTTAGSIMSSLPRQGVAQDNLPFIGLSMPVSSSSMGMGNSIERPIIDNSTLEVSRAPLVISLEPQTEENICTLSISDAAYGLINESIYSRTSPQMLSQHPQNLGNGLGLVADIFDESGNIACAGIICLSDDD